MSDQPAVKDTCGQMVDGQVASYPCEVEAKHEGPCSAREVPVSVQRRKQWQEQQGKAESPQETLSQFQGQPQTTAQRYTENPTPHPAAGTPERPQKPRSFARGTATVQRCPACTKGQHWRCDVTNMNIGAVDADDFIDVSCSCYDNSPDTHNELFHSVGSDASEPTKQRSEDQDLPEPNDHYYAHDLLVEDIMARQRLGIKRYGVGLQPFNGRDTLQDAYDEVLDLAVYLRALKSAAEADREVLVKRVAEAMGQKVMEVDGQFTFDDLAEAAVDTLLDEAPVR